MKLTLSFQSGSFSTLSKIQDKNLNIFRTKDLLSWNEKHFSSFLKGLSNVKNASAQGVCLQKILLKKKKETVFLSFNFLNVSDKKILVCYL